MQTLCLTIITLLLIGKAYSQQTASPDSAAVADLKGFLGRNVRPIASTVENNIQGTVVVSFKIDDNKNVTGVQVVKSLTREFEAEVLRVFQAYHQSILLPPAGYTAGVNLDIESRKTKIKPAPIDKSLYKNFLFEVTIITERR